MKLAHKILLSLVIVMPGCDDLISENDNNEYVTTGEPTVQTGIFLDAPVENIGYKTDSLNGVTNEYGEFQYIDGESVTFHIGDLQFPTVVAGALISPLDMAGSENIVNSAVVNIVKLLQTLDEDDNPDNGITITENAKQAATQVDFSLSENKFASSDAVINLIMNAGQNSAKVSLIDTDKAICAFENQLKINGILPNNQVLQRIGKKIVTEGNAIGVPQVVTQATTLIGNQFNLPLPNNFSIQKMSFDVELSDSKNKNGIVSIELETMFGVPAFISTFSDLQTLVGVINAQMFTPTAPQLPIGLVASAVDNGSGRYHIKFSDRTSNEASNIEISNPSQNLGELGLVKNDTSQPPVPAPVITRGGSAISNGYGQQSVDVIDPDENSIRYISSAGATANHTASELNTYHGVSAAAQTDLTLVNYNNRGNSSLILNGVTLSSMTIPLLKTEINNMSNTSLSGISAHTDQLGDQILYITSVLGEDLKISLASSDDGDSVSVQGTSSGPVQTLESDPENNGVATGNFNAETYSVVVGGHITITLDDGYKLENAYPQAVGLFQPLQNAANLNIVLLNYSGFCSRNLE